VPCERGQTTVEWTALILLAALCFGALIHFGPTIDGRSFGGFLAHEITCAVKGGCAGDREEQDALLAAYGTDDAELVRRYAPNIVYEPGTRTLPIDFRECRRHRCSDAPDDRDLDVHRSNRGRRATAFTHVVRSGGETFIQYWLYYPDSTSTVANAAGAWKYMPPGVRVAGRVATGRWDYPGYHKDDWESYQVRIGAGGNVSVRASSHHDYQGCKQARCKNRWTGWTGWTRVSWGSHAGHIPLRREVDGASVKLKPLPALEVEAHDEPQYPGVDLRERTTTAAGLRLVPLETLDRSEWVPLDPRHKPPWEKRVYTDPRSNTTG
jgi:hypothetical protein